MSSEHVEVLRHMKETIKAIMPSEVAALDAAIAALSAPQPPAEAQRCTCPSGDGSLRWPCPAHPPEAQAVGGGEEGFKAWVVEQMPAGTVIDNPAWWADRLAQAYAANVPQPPSAPVGVESSIMSLRDAANEIIRDGRVSRRAGYTEYLVTVLTDAADRLEALAQQPAAVDGAMVERAAKELRDLHREFGDGADLPEKIAREIAEAVVVAALAAQQGDRHD